MKTLYAKVHGNVQGVGYRDLVRRAALHLGITGSVKNEDDGSVSIIASGEDGSLDRFFKEIKVDYQYGPSVFDIEFMNESPKHTVTDRKGNKSFEVAR